MREEEKVTIDGLTFDAAQLPFLIDELEEIDSIRPYDMTGADFRKYLLDTEIMHNGAHSPDSKEGKWLKMYEQIEFFKSVHELKEHYGKNSLTVERPEVFKLLFTEPWNQKTH